MHQNSIIVGIPLNYSSFSSSQCVASCETSLPFHLHPKKETKNLWGWSTKSLIGGGNNFMTSMRRSPRDNFRGKNSQKSISYDIVCHLALLGDKGLSGWSVQEQATLYKVLILVQFPEYSGLCKCLIHWMLMQIRKYSKNLQLRT